MLFLSQKLFQISKSPRPCLFVIIVLSLPTVVCNTTKAANGNNPGFVLRAASASTTAMKYAPTGVKSEVTVPNSFLSFGVPKPRRGKRTKRQSINTRSSQPAVSNVFLHSRSNLLTRTWILILTFLRIIDLKLTKFVPIRKIQLRIDLQIHHCCLLQYTANRLSEFLLL